MSIFAVVPLNTLTLAKTRLAPALKPDERAALVRWMAARVLAAVLGSGAVAEVAVVSPSIALLSWAKAEGCMPIVQRSGGLNEGLELARKQALTCGATALVALQGDLPFLCSEDVRAMIQRIASYERVALVAPDRRHCGTNGLLLRPVIAMPFAFGTRSLSRHVALAREMRLPLLWYTSWGTSCDVDTPDDLRELRVSDSWASALPTWSQPD